MKTCLLPTHSFLKLSWNAALTLSLITLVTAAVGEEHVHRNDSAHEPSSPAAKNVAHGLSAVTTLPPLPAGVAELKFGDFFVRPVGTHGLELTDKLRQLDGRRVRVLGYMVQQEEPPPGRLLLAPVQAQIHEHDNGLADDLPASTLFVSVPTSPNAPVPFVPGLMLLTGTLSIGGRTEPDGRTSVVRLALDTPDKFPRSSASRKILSAPMGKGAERLVTRTSLKAGSRP